MIMKKRTKVLAFLIVVALLFTGSWQLFAGSEKEVAPSITKEETSEGPYAQKYTLQLWTRSPEKYKPGPDNFIKNTIKEKYNVEFEVIGRQGGDPYVETIKLRIATGDVPDMFWDMPFPVYDKFVEQGILAELSENMIEEKMPRYTAWLNKWLGDDPYSAQKRNGKIYSMPIIWSLGVNGQVPGIREDWLNNVGITKFPETLDELEVVFEKFTNDDPDNNGKKDTYGTAGVIGTRANDFTYFFSYVFGAFGSYLGIFTEENGTVVMGDIRPQTKDALTVLNRWYEKGIIDPEFPVDTFGVVQNKWFAEKIGYAVNWWWSLSEPDVMWDGSWQANLVKSNPDAKVTVIDFPKGPEGDQGNHQGGPLAGSGMLWGKHMEEEPGKMERYMEIFDEFSFNGESMEFSFYGIEGETFKLKNIDGGAGVEWIPPYDDELVRNTFGLSDGIAFPGCFNDYDLQYSMGWFGNTNRTDDKVAVEAKGTGKADILSHLEKPVYNQNKDVIAQYTKKNFVDFITGKRPLNEFDEFVEEWNSMGGKEVMEEARQKYSDFAKSNR